LSEGSPRVTVRLSERHLELLHATVAAKGQTVSDLVRGALAERLQAADLACDDGPEAA
jgi:predicted DNA binding CopG/RHH family protein